jgi:hypothetical protein
LRVVVVGGELRALWWPSCTTEGFEVILFKKERNLEGRRPCWRFEDHPEA